MNERLVRGDRMANVTQEVKDVLEVGGIATGYTFTSPDYGEFDAYLVDGTKLSVRVEVKE